MNCCHLNRACCSSSGGRDLFTGVSSRIHTNPSARVHSVPGRHPHRCERSSEERKGQEKGFPSLRLWSLITLQKHVRNQPEWLHLLIFFKPGRGCKESAYNWVKVQCREAVAGNMALWETRWTCSQEGGENLGIEPIPTLLSRLWLPLCVWVIVVVKSFEYPHMRG